MCLQVRELFVMAREHAPSIIFMDEVDSIGSARSESGGGGGGDSEVQRTMLELLNQLDGFEASNKIKVCPQLASGIVMHACMRGTFGCSAPDSPQMQARCPAPEVVFVSVPHVETQVYNGDKAVQTTKTMVERSKTEKQRHKGTCT
jgi:SpoVK/Ycf46/Vps4 family AAA+-type ATPase